MITNHLLNYMVSNPFQPGIDDIKQVINTIIYAIYGLVGVFLALRMAFLGWNLMHAEDDSAKVAVKKQMRDAVIGAAVIFGCALIANIVTSLFQVFEKS